MKVEVVAPEEFLGDVMGQINSRRGNIQGMDVRARQCAGCTRNGAAGRNVRLCNSTTARHTRPAASLAWNFGPLCACIANSVAEEILKANLFCNNKEDIIMAKAKFDRRSASECGDDGAHRSREDTLTAAITKYSSFWGRRKYRRRFD